MKNIFVIQRIKMVYFIGTCFLFIIPSELFALPAAPVQPCIYVTRPLNNFMRYNVSATVGKAGVYGLIDIPAKAKGYFCAPWDIRLIDTNIYTVNFNSINANYSGNAVINFAVAPFTVLVEKSSNQIELCPNLGLCETKLPYKNKIYGVSSNTTVYLIFKQDYIPEPTISESQAID